MSRQPPPPPSPPPFPEPFAHPRYTNTRQNVTGDPAYPQGGPGPGYVQPPQMTSPTGYPSQQYLSQQYPSSQQYSSSQQHSSSQQYSSSQPSATPSRRSTLATTPTYGHASLPPHHAPPHLSGSDPYKPSFPVPVRNPPNNPLGPAPPAPQPIAHRAATIPIPGPAPTTSSMPYDMQSPNTIYSPSQPGFMGEPRPTAQGYSYSGVHTRDDDRRNFSDEDLEQSREGTRHSGEYMRERAPPNHFAAGTPQQALVRCMICRKVTTRAAAESRRWYCTGGHMGVWQPA